MIIENMLKDLAKYQIGETVAIKELDLYPELTPMHVKIIAIRATFKEAKPPQIEYRACKQWWTDDELRPV